MEIKQIGSTENVAIFPAFIYKSESVVSSKK